MYFCVNVHRGSFKCVNAHITSGLVGARTSGCVPRGGNPWMPQPPCAIIVSTHGANRYGFDPAFPCHQEVLGAGKYGLTQLRNLDRLPATGAIVIAAPLPIVTGSGSPARVLALVEK